MSEFRKAKESEAEECYRVLEKNGYKRYGTVKIHGLRHAYNKILNEK